MAKTGAVWGIDIGNCALKALRCRPHDKETNRIVVEAFEYIEYPKLLTQPEADREDLIREALATFVAQNETKGDKVAISVPGQNGLSRFIELPPVEAKKIPDIVKYEARQQIPFALEDVVWDYQPLLGGDQDDGYALQTEVGLFAMKRDQVTRALEPLTEAGIDVDYIQLAPLAVYNSIVFDRMKNLDGAESYDPDNPPESIIVLSFGTDTTDLVITNGYRVWQRNIPIGGSHFTKALTKELQLTFSKAEHLKRNATKAEDPKALFSAMRPVFSDLVSEIQRSIGFFTSKNRNAKLGEIVALGNVMKLPGLQRYLTQNLDQKVTVPEEFSELVGGSVTDEATFRNNHLTFSDAYGLCVQALGYSQLSTNLLPGEITTERLVRAKKPWTVAAAAVLMIGLMGSLATYYGAWKSADVTEPNMDRAIKAAEGAVQTAQGFETTHTALKTQFDDMLTIRRNLRSNVDGRLMWLELLRAIDTALPQEQAGKAFDEMSASDISNLNRVYVDKIECEYMPDTARWYSGAGRYYAEPNEPLPDEPVRAPEGEGDADPDAAAEEGGGEPVADEFGDGEVPMDDPTMVDESFDDPMMDDTFGDEAGTEGPSGPGWVIEIRGYHFHNSDDSDQNNLVQRDNEGAEFLRKTILTQLEFGNVQLPSSDGQMVQVSMDDLGVSYPTLITRNVPVDVTYIPEAESDEQADAMVKAWKSYNGESTGGGGFKGEGGGFGAGGEFGTARGDDEPAPIEPTEWKLRRYEFTIQFLWHPKPRGERENPETVVDGEDDGFTFIAPKSEALAQR